MEFRSAGALTRGSIRGAGHPPEGCRPRERSYERVLHRSTQRDLRDRDEPARLQDSSRSPRARANSKCRGSRIRLSRTGGRVEQGHVEGLSRVPRASVAASVHDHGKWSKPERGARSSSTGSGLRHGHRFRGVFDPQSACLQLGFDSIRRRSPVGRRQLGSATARRDIPSGAALHSGSAIRRLDQRRAQQGRLPGSAIVRAAASVLQDPSSLPGRSANALQTRH